MMILEHHRKRDPDGFSAKHAPDVLITVGRTRGVAAASDVLPQLKLLLDARVDPNVPGLLEMPGLLGTSTSGVTELPLVLCALAALEPRRSCRASTAPFPHPFAPPPQSISARFTPTLTQTQGVPDRSASQGCRGATCSGCRPVTRSADRAPENRARHLLAEDRGRHEPHDAVHADVHVRPLRRMQRGGSNVVLCHHSRGTRRRWACPLWLLPYAACLRWLRPKAVTAQPF